MMQGYAAIIDASWTLALRNMRIQIREHALGYAWALITPMLYAICYIFIKRELFGNTANEGADADWDVIRAFAGITLFQLWMQTVQEMSSMIRRQKGMLRGLEIGAAPFVFAILIEGAVALLVRVLLIIASVPVLGLPYPAELFSWFQFILSLLVLLLSASAIGLLLAPWATLYKDVSKALQSINLPLILVSPIFYAATKNTDSFLYILNIVNPLASPLAVLFDSLKDTYSEVYFIPMIVWAGVSVMLLVLSIYKLRQQVAVLLERMGN